MEHVILSLISIAIILGSGMMLAQSAVLSADQFSSKWKDMEVMAEDLARTMIAATTAQAIAPWDGVIEVTVENTGQRTLGKFADWDVMVQYYDSSNIYQIRRLDYVSGTTLGDNQWVVYAIQVNGSSEIFQPGLLNPGEQVLLRLKPVPDLGNGKTLLVVVDTPNGVATSIHFES